MLCPRSTCMPSNGVSSILCVIPHSSRGTVLHVTPYAGKTSDNQLTLDSERASISVAPEVASGVGMGPASFQRAGRSRPQMTAACNWPSNTIGSEPLIPCRTNMKKLRCVILVIELMPVIAQSGMSCSQCCFPLCLLFGHRRPEGCESGLQTP